MYVVPVLPVVPMKKAWRVNTEHTEDVGLVWGVQRVLE